MKLLSLGKIQDAEARARIARHYTITELETFNEETLFSRIPEFEALIVPYTVEMLVSERVIDAGARLRLIASTYGGVRQNIADLYALAAGKNLIHTGASRARPMAEYTLAMILSSLLRVHCYHHDMCSGEAWPRFKYPRTRILHGRSVCVVGYGRIGRAICQLLGNFTDDIRVVSSHLSSKKEGCENLKLCSLDEGFAESEIIILAGGNNPDTYRLVGAKQFALMREAALFVNIARGQMVDQQAMIEAVEKGKIFLALDVFDPEPLEEDSPLRRNPNVLLTPHRANNSIEFENRWSVLAEDMEAFACGRRPESALTPELARVMSES